MLYKIMERINLQLFRVFMLACATMTITLIWLGGPEATPEFMPKIVFTFFVIGLANLLLWVSLISYRFLDKKV